MFSKETLFEKIWGYDYVSDAATVSVHINRLREKIEEDAYLICVENAEVKMQMKTPGLHYYTGKN